MPIRHGEDTKGHFIRWGNQKKYYYNPNNQNSYKDALNRVKQQIRAIYYNGYKG